jgi:hypothetical protein
VAEAFVVKDKNIHRLSVGEAIVSIPGREPFRFRIEPYAGASRALAHDLRRWPTPIKDLQARSTNLFFEYELHVFPIPLVI